MVWYWQCHYVTDADTKEVEQKHKINVYTVNENTEVNNYGRGILTSIDEGSDVSHISQLSNAGGSGTQSEQDLFSNQLLKPAGITSVEVKTEGDLGELIE